MDEEKNIPESTEMADGQVEQVEGGFAPFTSPISQCPFCKKWNTPVLNASRTYFICPAPGCGKVRKKATGILTIQ